MKKLILYKHKLFAETFVTKEFFGNGVQTYIEVYNPDKSKRNWYQTAKFSANQILTNINLCEYVSYLLESIGLNDNVIDKQLLFLITQHSDFSTKLGALKEYDKIKSRITSKVKIESDLKVNGYDIRRAPRN